MKCKNCGAEITGKRTLCPECGEPLDDYGNDILTDVGKPVSDTPEAYITHAADNMPDDISNSAQPSISDGSASAPKGKPHAMRSVVAIVLAAAVFLTLVVGLIFALRGDKEQPEVEAEKKVEETLTDDAPLPVPDAVLAEIGDHKLDNETFLFYYWDEFYYLYKQYGTNITYLLDPSKSLALQEFEEGTSWREYLTERALETWAQTMILCDAADKAGFTLSAEDEAELAGIPDKLKTYAESSDFKDSVSYLRTNYDEVVTLEGYQEYLSSTYFASGFVNTQYQKFMDEYEDLADQKKYMVNIRHILIQPEDETDAGKGKAKVEAERIYALWKENPTEDNFAALAKEYSKDTGSSTNGGLYSDVAPGNMVQSFNDWCFTEGRKAGDNGIVETNYGYHIMYFSGFSTNAYESAQETAAGADYDEWIGKMLEKTDYTRTDNQIGFSR